MWAWVDLVDHIKKLDKTVTIGLVGKYVKFHDCYLSVSEALAHAGYYCGAKVKIKWIESENLNENNIANKLKDCDGIIVPGGFGERGIEGMICTAKYCRENNIPYFGICLGMQVAVIEFARDVCGLTNANSREFNEESPYKVIDFLPDQNNEVNKGGTLRLGSYPCHLQKGTKILSLYQKEDIKERHRHRYEFNNEFRELLISKGLVIGGTSPDSSIVETIELKNDYFVGVQFHPECKSRPNHAHPLFIGLIDASLNRKKDTL